MSSKPFNLIPYGVELFKVVFENFILGGFDSKFISGNGYFIDFKVLFLSDQDLKEKIFHGILEYMYNDLMKSLNILQLNDVGGVGLDDGGYDLETVLYNVKEKIGWLIGSRTDDWNIEELFFKFGHLFLYHADIKL